MASRGECSRPGIFPTTVLPIFHPRNEYTASGRQASPMTAAKSQDQVFGIRGMRRTKNMVRPNHIGRRQPSRMRRWKSPRYHVTVAARSTIRYSGSSLLLPSNTNENIRRKQMVRNTDPKKMMMERNRGRTVSASAIQDSPSIRLPMFGMMEIMVPVTPTMVKRRKFSQIKLRIVKGFFAVLPQEGHTASGEDNSFPHTGQVFMKLRFSLRV
jgi:hypothetical protein